jgi:uncharacterized protein YifN (PemK superfamily)
MSTKLTTVQKLDNIRLQKLLTQAHPTNPFNHLSKIPVQTDSHGTPKQKAHRTRWAFCDYVLQVYENRLRFSAIDTAGVKKVTQG